MIWGKDWKKCQWTIWELKESNAIDESEDQKIWLGYKSWNFFETYKHIQSRLSERTINALNIKNRLVWKWKNLVLKLFASPSVDS